MNLRDVLAKKLSREELELVPSSFDVVGDIAIFNDLPEELEKKEGMVASALMSIHSNIKVVAKKIGKYGGKLRTPRLKIIGGEKRKETMHRESGCLLRLHVEKCYFSPRLSQERLRIARLVKKGEDVLVLFSGVGVYPCVIAKNAAPRSVVGVELNKVAHQYGEENVRLNKVEGKVRVYCGDVRKVLPRLKKKFDRIIMPLPQDSLSYFGVALKKLRTKGSIHLYLFASEAEKLLVQRSLKKQFRSVKAVVCGHYAPGVFRICFDVKT